MRAAALIAAVLWSASAAAQYALEIIPLRHATAEQVLPVLQPLLEPGATISAASNQLFVRASPANVADLKRVLETIDRAPRRLQILVRYGEAGSSARSDLGAGGVISNRGSSVEIRAGAAARQADERFDQQVTVLEGGRAFIAAGTSGAYRERESGFQVAPRLAGERVTLDIYQQQESGAHFERLSTSVSGRLGEWIELGGTATSSARDERGILSSSRSASSSSRGVWLQVRELAN